MQKTLNRQMVNGPQRAAQSFRHNSRFRSLAGAGASGFWGTSPRLNRKMIFTLSRVLTVGSIRRTALIASIVVLSIGY
jgi:hypothetical protein